MKPNHHLDFVRIKLITEKRLYSEEELTGILKKLSAEDKVRKN